MVSQIKERLNFDTEWEPNSILVKKLLNRENISVEEWQSMFVVNNRIGSWIRDGSAKILKALKKRLGKHTRRIAERVHGDKDDNVLVRAYGEEWANYYFLVEHLPEPFSSVGGFGLPMRNTADIIPMLQVRSDIDSRPSAVRDEMLSAWNKRVFTEVEDKLLAAAMKLVEKDRLGEIIDQNMVVHVRDSFIRCDYDKPTPVKYHKIFEARYVQECVEFYQKHATQLIGDVGMLSYMQYASDKLTEEEERAKKYLDLSRSGSFDLITQSCASVLVLQFQSQLLAEASGLIEQRDIGRLRHLYKLINKTSNGMPPLLDTLTKLIRAEGLKVIRDNANDIVNNCERYVSQLIEVFNGFSSLVKEAFYDDTRFLTVRDQVFQEVVNNTDIFCLELNNPNVKNKMNQQPPESRCPELLANYCDMFLRKSPQTKNLSSDEIEKKLEDVLLILKYASNKDVFMRYYKCNLGRRLLLETSTDQDKERFLIEKFRDCGMAPDFTSKLSQMLQDVELSKDLHNEFKRVFETSANKAVADRMNLKVLNSGAWTRGRDKCHVSFPPMLEDIIPEVEEFYRNKHNGRKLNWAHNWSTANISFLGEKGQYDLEVSAFQMAILFVWNDRPTEKISLEGLRLATQLAEVDLLRTLMSLITNPRVKEQVVLTDNGATPINPKNFTDSTMFWVNRNFVLMKKGKPEKRGRVNLVSRLNMNQESIDNEAHEEIMRLREFRIQEAIVQIMKARRVMNHVPLHNEVVNMLKNMFAPTLRLIKQQVEWLIERDYIERDKNDPEKFIYIT